MTGMGADGGREGGISPELACAVGLAGLDWEGTSISGQGSEDSQNANKLAFGIETGMCDQRGGRAAIFQFHRHLTIAMKFDHRPARIQVIGVVIDSRPVPFRVIVAAELHYFDVVQHSHRLDQLVQI